MSHELVKRHKMSNPMDGHSFFRIPPFFYMHVVDQTTNVTSVETGPQNLPCEGTRRCPPPSHPNGHGTIEKDRFGQIKLSHGDEEIRLQRDPFPLYPGEKLKVEVTPLTIVHSSSALLLKVIRNFTDEDKTERVAGDLYLFEGPGTYFPRKEVEVVKTITATVIHENEALKLSAARETLDRSGCKRVAGEEWLVRKPGAYLPLAQGLWIL
ncbi:MVP [Lepeophtheirus salmonis]|uniref:MVP n=1 Tax=Lepeophtheirus salmonis TaxID=72036 RepID=A0A7R8CIE9_LEPSM|nr:MVP [Lepeophtheirus salmonis]CAF2795044.1 MVP [Lepeophtheirus salmonis]